VLGRDRLSAGERAVRIGKKAQPAHSSNIQFEPRALSDTNPTTTRQPAYRGSESFVFVCYSHREEQRIEAEIAALSARGIRIKYDEGIEPGQTWQDHLAEAIETCCAFLIFISKYSIASDDCRRELTFALTKRRPVVAVHLDDVELPSAMRLQLGDRQAIIRSRFTEAEYRERLTAAMLTYQNATSSADAGADDLYAPFERTRNQRRRRGLLLASVLGGVAIAATTLVAFRPQIGSELRLLEAPVKKESIVVLPFENASGRDSEAYLSEGFSDELRDQLTHVRALRVLARSSSTAFRGQNKPASAIAKGMLARSSSQPSSVPASPWPTIKMSARIP